MSFLKLNSVEKRQTRKAKRNEIKSLHETETKAAIAENRDYSPEVVEAIKALQEDIEKLNSLIATDDAVEAGDADDTEDRDVADEDDEKKDDDDERSYRKPKTQRRTFDNYGANIVTSKTRKDSHTYSLARAMIGAASDRGVRGLERERSDELAHQRGEGAKGNIIIDTTQPLLGRHVLNKRTFNTTAAGTAVGVDVRPTVIDLIQNRTVLDQIGVEWDTNIKGKFSKPRQLTGPTSTIVAEGSTSTPSNPTYDAVAFQPRTMMCDVAISRKAIFETAFDVESTVADSMSKVFASEFDKYGLVGDGTGENPTGVLYTASVNNIALDGDGGSGGVISRADLIKFETAVANANFDFGKPLVWVSTPGVRGLLKDTPKETSYPSYLMDDDGLVLGYDFYHTNNMLSNLTKGSGSSLHSIILAAWEWSTMATWQGIDVLVDPFTLSNSAAIRYVMYMDFDFRVLRPKAFSISTAVRA